MLYAIMCVDSWGRVGVSAIRETRESAEEYAAYLNEDIEDFHWVNTVKDDGGIGTYLESGYNGEAE